MKTLPHLQSSAGGIYRSVISAFQVNLMMAGINLGIFSILDEEKTADQVARPNGYHPHITRAFLDLLVSSGFLCKNGEMYQNTRETSDYLVKGKDTYLGELFLSQSQNRLLLTPGEIEKRIRDGPEVPTKEGDLRSDISWATVARNMANWERAGSAQMITAIISSLPEFPSMKRILDLGGGPGLMSIAILLRKPDLCGIIFDQPSVIQVTKSFIDEYDLLDRMETIAGNYLTDDLGGKYDLILSSFSLNFAGERKSEIIQKIYEALNQGGVFVSIHDGMEPDGTKPEIHALAHAQSTLSGYSITMRKGEIAEKMLDVGFRTVHSRTIDLDFGPADIDIGRK